MGHLLNSTVYPHLETAPPPWMSDLDAWIERGISPIDFHAEPVFQLTRNLCARHANIAFYQEKARTLLGVEPPDPPDHPERMEQTVRTA